MNTRSKSQHLETMQQSAVEEQYSRSDLKPGPQDPPPPEDPPPEKSPSEILDLAPDGVRTTFGTETLIDVGLDATVKPGTAPLRKLKVLLPADFNSFEHLGLKTNDRVSASDGINPGSIITVDGVEIGTIPRASDQWGLIFDFNDNATPELVQELIRCLTYTNTSQDHFIYSGDIEFQMFGMDGQNWSTYANVIVAPVTEMVLTAGTDSFVGADRDDVFYALMQSFTAGDAIVGGDGFDTLVLHGGGMFDLSPVMVLTGVEKIQGTDAEDSLTISAGQLSAIKTVDGGGDIKHGTDFLQLKGSYFDLTTKDILNFEEINLVTEGATVVVDDVEMAKLIWGRTYQGETLVLTQGTLTDPERLQLHRQGIDTIITLADGATTKHEAPRISNLDGDSVTISSTTVYIDAGRDVKIDSDDGLLSFLDIIVVDSHDTQDVLEIDTSGRIQLSNGYKPGSRVTIDGVDIGAIGEDYLLTQPGLLPFVFNGNATPALVEELLQAITYRNTNGRIDEAKEIEISLYDAGFRPAMAQIVTIDPEVIEPEANTAPTDIHLSAKTVTELSAEGTVIGALSAQDKNVGEAFTYTLKNNAGDRFEIVNGNLVVKQGIKLDYEQAQSHEITIMVQDAGGLTFEKSFSIAVTDVNPETTNGSSGSDVIVGGAGRDNLSGGAERDSLSGGADRDSLSGGADADTLSGGSGNDRLTGGTGRDSLTGGSGKDTFIFLHGDTGLGAVRDAITDFRHGIDRIDLAKIDANWPTRADDRFTELLTAGSAFTKAGQLRYDATTGILSGNIDRDARAEFQIQLKNKPALLTLSDFVL